MVKENEKLEIAEELREQMKYMFVPTSCIDVIHRLSKEELNEIDEDKEVAKEMIFKILSNFSSTYATDVRTKNLYSGILDAQVRLYKQDKDGRRVQYTKILDLLIKKGLIEKTKNYSTHTGKSNEYALTAQYYDYKITKIIPKTEIGKKIQKGYADAIIEGILGSKIAIEMFRMRKRITFPTIREMRKNLKKAIRNGYTNSEGKKLIFLGNRNRLDFPNNVFAEDYLAKYKSVRDNYTLPIVGGESSGGRVYSAVNMLGKVMRKYLLIDGEELIQLDFSTLHPNIASMLFGGVSGSISHDQVAKFLGVSREQAKKAHLSFFNLKSNRFVRGESNTHNMIMSDSILFDYYAANEPKMLTNILMDKNQNGYKITSAKLFAVETKLMSYIIEQLSDLDICSIYVFDALLIPKSKVDIVRRIMNESAETFSIDTTVN